MRHLSFEHQIIFYVITFISYNIYTKHNIILCTLFNIEFLKTSINILLNY